jgi:hypothetical protein
MKTRFTFTLALMAFWCATPAQTATLIVESGLLVGATEVDVAGSLYDVSFIDGSCITLFDGCDSASDFPFGSALDTTSGLAAAQSLLDQVFVGAFDTSPGLTRGCSDVALCIAFIPTLAHGPTDVAVLSSVAANDPGINTDTIGGGYIGRTDDTTPIAFAVWAKFSPSASSAVPEPSTWAMFILGFGVIGAVMRRRLQFAATA